MLVQEILDKVYEKDGKSYKCTGEFRQAERGEYFISLFCNGVIESDSRSFAMVFILEEFKPPRWRALMFEEYYYISDKMDICCAMESCSYTDKARWLADNYFECASEVLDALIKVREVLK